MLYSSEQLCVGCSLCNSLGKIGNCEGAEDEVYRSMTCYRSLGTVFIAPNLGTKWLHSTNCRVFACCSGLLIKFLVPQVDIFVGNRRYYSDMCATGLSEHLFFV